MTARLPEELTTRELECLRGVYEHKRSKVIADELGLSPKTVDTYIAAAARKLGVTDRDTAVRLLVERYPALWGRSPSAFSDIPAQPQAASEHQAERLPWPVPTANRLKNDYTVSQKLAWVVVLAALMLAAASLYMLGMRMLSEQL